MFKKFALVVLGWAMLSSGAAHALSVKEVYGYCKPFANNGFNIQGAADGVCIGYVKVVTTSRQYSCEFLKDQLQRGSISADSETWRSRNFLGSDTGEITALIQTFLNWAEDNPTKWSQLFVGEAFRWMTGDYPCKAD